MQQMAQAGAEMPPLLADLRRVYAEVRAQGVEEMMIGVLATNDRVRRFYEREGFAPWVLLTLGKVPAE